MLKYLSARIEATHKHADTVKIGNINESKRV